MIDSIHPSLAIGPFPACDLLASTILKVWSKNMQIKIKLKLTYLDLDPPEYNCCLDIWVAIVVLRSWHSQVEPIKLRNIVTYTYISLFRIKLEIENQWIRVISSKT